MTRVSPRTNLHSSQLVRCLVDLDLLGAAAPADAFAERLGQWIHFTDAITLSAIHNDGVAAAAQTPVRSQRPEPHRQDAAAAEFERIRDAMMKSIRQSFSSGAARSHIQLPPPPLDVPPDLATTWPPYRRFYEAHQRDMELRVQPLRFNTRQAVAKASPALRKLAELDAIFDKILRERESRLLSKVPLLLKKRFEQLFNEHQQGLADNEQADNPARWTQADGWLARFCADMQILLQAEADFRLQPVLGLMEALKQDTQ